MIKIPPDFKRLNYQELLKLQKSLSAQYREIMNRLVDLSRQKTQVWVDMKGVDKLLDRMRKIDHEKNRGGRSHP